jgi:superfamily II DNA/RNA helicase
MLTHPAPSASHTTRNYTNTTCNYTARSEKQQLKEEKPHVIIGSPGRVLDLADKGALKLDKVKHFVLDECDKMLEAMDMRQKVQQIFLRTPQNKQVMMFSATMAPEVRPVCIKFMKEPLEVQVGDGPTKLTLHGLALAAVRLAATSSDSTVLVANPHGWNWMPPEALTTHRPPFFTPLATVGTVEAAS